MSQSDWWADKSGEGYTFKAVYFPLLVIQMSSRVERFA